MADAGDLKSPVRNGRVGSNPTSAIIKILKNSMNHNDSILSYVVKLMEKDYGRKRIYPGRY